MPGRDFIRLGRVLKPQGIKGEISIEFNADSLFLLDKFIYLLPHSFPAPDNPGPENLLRYNVEGLRMHKGRPLLFLEGIDDRNAAELLRNHLVFVPRARLPELKDDEVYLGDLPGLRVLTRDGAFTDGKPLGVIASVSDAGGQEIWTIKTPEGKEVLFPATEEFVAEINLERGFTVIAPPLGLLELYLR